MTLWVDVEDLFVHARFASRPSGIQRLSFGICSALVATHGVAIGFVRHDSAGHGYRTVIWDEVRDVYERMAHAPRPAARPAPDPHGRYVERRWTARIPVELRDPLGQAARAQVAAIAAIWRAVRAAPRLLRRAPRGREAGRWLRNEARPGDTLCIFGALWTDVSAAMVERAKRELGLRLALLVHDLIPILKPEYVAPGVIEQYTRWHSRCLPLADQILANSRSTARDLEAWADRAGLALARPILTIPVGTGFPLSRANTSSPSRALPTPGSYVPLICTIEARKNHALAFRAWRRLLQEMPADRVPTLVFAGRIGWMVTDLMRQIRNSRGLDGKLLIIEDPSDDELAALYAGCRFTLFPSHYEGWGLPVTESLGFGKTCLASSSASLPEAGGAFCLYFDPDNATEATALIRRAIEEPGLIAGLEARIRAEFRPVSWTRTADVLLRHLAPAPEAECHLDRRRADLLPAVIGAQ